LLAKASSTADEKIFSIETKSLAAIRTSVGKRLSSNDASTLESGTYSYTLTIGSDSYNIDLEIDNPIGARATNRSVLLEIERSINRLGLDVEATLTDKKIKDYNPYRENAYESISYLTISSRTTGEDNSFSLTDTSGSLIKDLGLNKTTQFGQNNQYSINGIPDESDSNSAAIESGKVWGYFFDTTEPGENLSIDVRQGKDALSSELKQVISDYNELIRWIDDMESIISPALKATLFKGLSSIATQDKRLKIEKNREYADLASVINLQDQNTIDNALADIGLTLNSDGTLDIGDEFSKSVSADLRAVHNSLAGPDGFFTAISDAIEKIHGKNESNYVFAYNSVLSYNANKMSRTSIYNTNSPGIINFFA
ncbi:MAG: flagellar filament capping protein FliD, partial [Desulfobacula sp.]